jgi:hypothetical protein
MEVRVKVPPLPSMLLFVLVGLATLLIALASPTAPAIAQVVTPAPNFSGIDNIIDQHLPRVATYQAAYLLGHGRYFQGLWSHAATPDEASNNPPDQLTGRPTDQLEDFGAMWSQVAIGQGRIPMRLRVDVYSGPAGQGYVMTFETSRAGVAYQRVVNVGPESWRNANWIASPVAGGEAATR